MDTHRIKDDDEAVRTALSSLKTATGIPVTMYGTLLPDNRLQITQWVGLRTPALQNLIIEPNVGVGGRVVSTRRAVGVSDYVRANTISHENDRYIQDDVFPRLLLSRSSFSAKSVALSTSVCILLFAWVTRSLKKSL